MQTEQAETTRKRKDDQTVPSREEEGGELIPQGKLFSFKGLDDKYYSLTPKQKLFCDNYVANLGNGVQAAMGVYETDYKGACIIASQNLRKLKVIEYLTLQFKKFDIGDEEAMAHLSFLIKQFGELPMKAKGLDMFFKIRGKYAPEKTEHSVNEGLEKALDRLSALLP